MVENIQQDSRKIKSFGTSKTRQFTESINNEVKAKIFWMQKQMFSREVLDA